MDKRKLSIILAVVCALLGLFLLKNWVSSTESKIDKEEKKAYCLVATVNIPAGTTLDETMMRPEAIPEKYIQPKAISSQGLAVGKRALAEIMPGEQILATKISLAAREASATMAMRTPQGKRATALTVPMLSAVAGKIRTGDYVDVVGSFPFNTQVDGKTVSELVTVTLFQNVLILNVEGSAAPVAERGKTPGPAAAQASSELVVTLALGPQEANILAFVQDQTKLRLLLRPPLETKAEPVKPVDLNGMWQYIFSNLGQDFITPKESKKEPEKKSEPLPPSVEVYRGSEKSSMLVK